MHRKKKPRFIQEIVQAHRVVGMVSAVFMLLLAITGMLLNHTDALKLDQRYVQSRMMLWWYGMTAPDVMHSYPVGDAWLTQLEGRLYYNGRELGGRYTPLQGAIDVGDEVAVALADRLLLLDRQGNMLEEIRPPGHLPPLQAIGESGGQVVVRGDKGRYIADRALSQWSPLAGQGVRWATDDTPPPALRTAIRERYQSRMLKAERVVRDLHNGRILGPWGALLMDLMALAFIVMASSGIWMWWQRRNGLLAEGKKARKSTH